MTHVRDEQKKRKLIPGTYVILTILAYVYIFAATNISGGKTQPLLAG